MPHVDNKMANNKSTRETQESFPREKPERYRYDVKNLNNKK